MTRYEPYCDCLGGHVSMVPDPNGRWCRADDPSGIVHQMPLGGDEALVWQSLHEWTPKEGTWAILWPGYYGPFTACWIRGRWTMCEDIDFKHATIGAEMQLPHLVTEAVPFVDRGRATEADLRAEVERLRQALQPFAAIADLFDREVEGHADTDEFSLFYGDDANCLVDRFTFAQFRAALAALSPETDGGQDG